MSTNIYCKDCQVCRQMLPVVCTHLRTPHVYCICPKRKYSGLDPLDWIVFAATVAGVMDVVGASVAIFERSFLSGSQRNSFFGHQAVHALGHGLKSARACGHAVGDEVAMQSALQRYEDIDFTFAGSREGNLYKVPPLCYSSSLIIEQRTIEPRSFCSPLGTL